MALDPIRDTVDPHRYTATYAVTARVVALAPVFSLYLLGLLGLDVAAVRDNIPERLGLWTGLWVAMLLAVGTAVLVWITGSVLGYLIAGLTRRVALRVEESGVTLGGVSVFGPRRPVFVPWQDITAVVRFRRFVGLQLRPDARRRGGLARLRYRVPADIVRPIVGYRFDLGAFLIAVAYHAPQVEFRWPVAPGRRVRLPAPGFGQDAPRK